MRIELERSRGAARRLLFAARPARLIAALIGTAAVAGSSLATTAVAGAVGAGDPGLAFVLGGLICLNTLLFFAPGSLGPHPRRIPMVLAANLVPLVALAWLLRHEQWLADLVLVLASGAAVLARPFGSLAGAFALAAIVNILAALLLGSAGGFLLIGAISAVLGSAIAPVADLLQSAVLARLGRAVERHLLLEAAGAFLDEAGRRWRDGGWDADWYRAHEARFAAIADDFGLGSGGAEPLAPQQMIGVIGRAGKRLYEARADLPPVLAAEIGAAWTMLAARLKSGRSGEAVIDRLRVTIAGLPVQDERGELATSYALAVALLLAELGSAALHPKVVVSRRPRARSRVGGLERRLAVQAVVCVIVALVVAHLMRAERPYWIALTAVILTSASFGETLRKSYERLLGTIGGLIAGELLWVVLAGHAVWLNAVTLVAIVGLFFGRAGAYRWLLFWLTLVLALLLNEAGESSLLVGGRLVDTLIGAAIVVVVTRFLLPVRAARVAARRGRAVLSAIAARLRAGFGASDSQLRGEVAEALASLRIASDAELLEAGLRRKARERIATRMIAADRIAGAFLAFDSVPAEFRPEAGTEAAIEATARMADSVANTGVVPESPDITASAHALFVHARAQAEGGERLRLELRVLALLEALDEAIGALAGAIGSGTARGITA